MCEDQGIQVKTTVVYMVMTKWLKKKKTSPRPALKIQTSKLKLQEVK